ncbi:hypothetical protein [Microvirga subterranea]|uniref:Uncharacterized protein n=1 Tax=Microvirga subterranea TaxID=186651 RepID=A0A370HKY9_9HYPH|nr:hypothetical protein [Microvirga subterranea]RDI56368.1 hypothetical protein DES45_10952 [Microvirga subterranea]
MRYVVAVAAAVAAYLMAGIPWDFVGTMLDEAVSHLSGFLNAFSFRHAVGGSIIGAVIAAGLLHWRRKANAAKWRRTLARRARA